MASIRERTWRDGTKQFEVRWRQDGKSASESFTTQKAAFRFRGRVDAEGQRWPPGWVPGQGMVTPKEVSPTLAEWFARSVASRSTANARTRYDYQRDFNRNVTEWLSKKPMGEIT